MNSEAVVSAVLPTTLHIEPTRLLDYQHEIVQSARAEIGIHSSDLAYLRAAHLYVQTSVAPIYTINELQPVSVTLAKLQGSCSQRLACLEALARAQGIPTRVRALWIRGQFWARRFSVVRWVIPRQILLAWPQFCFDGAWMSVENLFGDVQQLSRQNPHAYTNTGESLFDALAHTAIDFDGKTSQCENGICDLSAYLIGYGGTFASRDDLFAAMPLFQYTWRGRMFEKIFGGKNSAQQ